MAERKVLNKYFPKNFDHEKIVKRGRGKDKLMIVRNMLPMSLRCNTCSNYLYIGTKYNMRMEICNDEVYLGIKVFRFYLKCTYCYADITFKTDPKNHDYIVQTGGTRNYEPVKDAQQAQKLLKKMKINQKQGDSMKYLQNKTYDSKRQMQLTETLQEIKNLNKRQGVIDPEDLLKNIIYIEQQEDKMNQQQQLQIDRAYEELCERNYQKKLKEMQEAKISSINHQNNLNHQSIAQQKEQNNDCQNQQEVNLSQNNHKPLNHANNGFLKANSITNSNGQNSGKKFVFPVVKSKLDKYKKKIIKKDPKQQTDSVNSIQQVVTNQ